jgi:hypothetical protein
MDNNLYRVRLTADVVWAGTLYPAGYTTFGIADLGAVRQWVRSTSEALGQAVPCVIEARTLRLSASGAREARWGTYWAEDDDAPFVPTPVDIEAWNTYAHEAHDEPALFADECVGCRQALADCDDAQARTDQALADFAACVESPARVLLIVPSETDLPADLYFGDVDYHEGWVFDTETEARAFAEKAVAEHPGVVVDFEIKPVEVAG